LVIDTDLTGRARLIAPTAIGDRLAIPLDAALTAHAIVVGLACEAEDFALTIGTQFPIGTVHVRLANRLTYIIDARLTGQTFPLAARSSPGRGTFPFDTDFTHLAVGLLTTPGHGRIDGFDRCDIGCVIAPDQQGHHQQERTPSLSDHPSAPRQNIGN